jgi:DNA-binding MarR family transcriptional regulator
MSGSGAAPSLRNGDTQEPGLEPVLVAMSEDVSDLVELSRLLVSVAYRSLDAAPEPVQLPPFRALAVLARFGPCTVGGLAETLGTPASTVTRMCDKLVASGWVTRQNRPDNRREVEIALTDNGRNLVREVLTARAAELENILAGMSATSRRALGRLLPQLLSAADAAVPRPREAWAV